MSASFVGIACLCIVAWIHGATVGVAFGDEILSQWVVMTCAVCLPALFLITYSDKTRRLAAAIFYFVFSGIIMSVTSALCWYRNPKDAPMLPDIGHEVFPHIREFRIPFWHAEGEYVDARTLPDIFITFLVVSSAGLVIMSQERVTLLRRFFTIYSTLMLMRSLTISVTTLPDSLPICQEMTPGTQPWYEISVRQVILRALKMSLPVGELSCGDLAVSGHSIILVMCAMLWHTYYPSVRGMNVVKTVMWLVCYAGLFAILLVRLHYTLDIILAVYLTITVWCQYHRIAHDVITGDSFQMVWLVDGLFVYPLVSWMEEGAPPIPKILLHEAATADSIVQTFQPKQSGKAKRQRSTHAPTSPSSGPGNLAPPSPPNGVVGRTAAAVAGRKQGGVLQSGADPVVSPGAPKSELRGSVAGEDGDGHQGAQAATDDGRSCSRGADRRNGEGEDIDADVGAAVGGEPGTPVRSAEECKL